MLYLHVYRNPAGQWSGRVLREEAGIAGCASPAEVWEAAFEQFSELAPLPGAETSDEG